MKKHILISGILLVLVCSLVVYKSLSKNNEPIDINKNISELHNNTVAVMVETDANTGVYEQLATSDWPTDGYVFNSEKSYCENGSEIIWNDATNSLNVSINKSDKCYVYFDKQSVEPVTDEPVEGM